MDVILKRRSIRRWVDRPVEEEKIKKILAAAMAAPSAGNQMPWEFFVVTNKDILAKLAEVSPFAGCAKNAPAAIVTVYRENGLKFPEFAEIDSAIASENILLAISALGLGGVWLGIAPVAERMRKAEEILGLHDKHVFALIPFGYPALKLKPNHKYDEDRVTYIK